MENFYYRSILVDSGSIVHCTKTQQLETVSPFAGASQDQAGESERVHMGRHLQTPGASDQNFVLIMIIWSCIKQLILETQLSIQFIFWSHNVLHLASNLISKCLQVLYLVPWRGFSQSEFLEFVVPSDVLPQVFFSVMSCQRFKSGNGCCPL